MVIKAYCKRKPSGALCRYLGALQAIDNAGGGDSRAGLSGFEAAVQSAGKLQAVWPWRAPSWCCCWPG